jgi:diguanylate cyclase (GGDEF)-like protein
MAPVSDDILRKRQAILLTTALVLMAAYGAVIGLLNLAFFDSPGLAVLDLTVTAVSLGALWYFHSSGRLLTASWVAILTLAGLLLTYLLLAQAANASLLWVTVLPPIAFFLLGSRDGLWVTVVFSLLVLAWLLWRFEHLDPPSFTLGAVLNSAEVLLAHVLIFRFSERTREAAFERLRTHAQVDGLTGLANREKLDVELARSLSLADRSGQPLAVAMIDLDHFKRINDEHGHLVGDEVLRGLASRLAQGVRAMDTVGRWGGEEFLLLCPNTDAGGALAVAEKLRSAVAAEPFAEGVSLTISLGVAIASGKEAPDVMLDRADRALYEAKKAGRNRVMLDRS